MAIDVECTDCKTRYSIDEQFVGKRVKCRSCGGIFTVAAATDSLPVAGADPFENAVFEKPASRMMPAPQVKLYNPIDPIADYKKLEEEPQAPGRGGINYQTKPQRRAGSAVGLDSASSTVLAVYLLGVAAVGIYASIEISNITVKPGMPSASTLIGHLWATLATSVFFFFVFVGPMTLLGIWATSKMLSFPLADAAYFRACAVAALPSVFSFISLLLPLPFNLLVLLVAIPVTYYMLTMVFEVTWGEGVVAFILGAAGSLIGGTVSVVLLIFVVGVSALTMQRDAKDAEADAQRQKMIAQAPPGNDGGSNSSGGQYTPPPPTPPDRSALDQFEQLVSRTTSADLSKSTREERQPDVDSLNAQLRQLQARFHDDPAWPGLQQKIDAFATAVGALPSAAIDPSVFVEIPDSADDWTIGKLSRGKLAPEVSFKQFKLQVPQDMKLDLASGEDATEGLVWSGPNNSSQLRIVMRPRNNPKQLRPVLAMKPAIQRAAETAGLLVYDGSDIAATFGQINSIPFTKIVVNPNSTTQEHFTEYVAAVDNNWLIIHLLMPGDSAAARVLDAAARTARKIDDGEAKVDPFSAKALAPRLADDSEHAAPMLRALGAKAEDALLALLQGDDATLKRRALEILQDVATEKSLPALRTAALDADQTNATLARTAIRRISPNALAGGPPMPAAPDDNAGPPTDPADLLRVLADLNGEDAARRKNAVARLAFMTPTARERPAIQSKLSGMLRTHDNEVPVADIIAALTKWGDASVGPDLLPLLKQDVDAALRHAAMRVLGAVKCVQAAPPLVRWLKIDPIPTSDALIDMGPGAEPSVLPFLNDADATVQIDAARILERIGTKKSAAELTRHAKGGRDPSVRAAAQIALDAVNARLADEKPATPAPPGK